MVKKIILLIIMVFLMVGVASAEWCYQETANESHPSDGSCDLNYTGSYFDAGTNPVETRQSTLYINYTKPNYATNNSIWTYRIDDANGVGDIIVNMTLPSACWSQDPLQLRYGRFAFGASNDGASCYNGAGWTILADYGRSNPSGAGLTGSDILYDGNWNTGLSPAYTSGIWYTNYGASTANGYYEEAMYWDLPDGVNASIYSCDIPAIVYVDEAFVMNCSWYNPSGNDLFNFYYGAGILDLWATFCFQTITDGSTSGYKECSWTISGDDVATESGILGAENFVFQVEDQDEGGIDTESLPFTLVYFNGSGNSSHPYQIYNEDQFRGINYYLTSEFILMDDIVFTEDYAITGTFEGVLNGNGKTLSGLTTSNSGLFDSIDDVEIYNLTLENFTIGGATSRGCLAKWNEGGLISLHDINVINCDLGTESTYAGGLIGAGASYNGEVIISDIYIEDLTGSASRTGGLIGASWTEVNPSLFDRIAIVNANITGSTAVGGLFGWSYLMSDGDDVLINNSYFIGNLSGNLVGGLVGDVLLAGGGSPSVSVHNSYSAFEVGSATNIGGIIADNSLSNCYDSYYNSDFVTTTIGCGSGLTSQQMVSESNYSGFDFSYPWSINEGVSYPYLPVTQSIIGPYVCSANITNTSWSSYTNSSCLLNDTYDYSRYLVQYDSNYCGEVANATFWDNGTAACDYCTPDIVNSTWSNWVNETECLENSTILQSRNLTEYDNNNCYSITGLPADEFTNSTYNETQYDSCVYIAPPSGGGGGGGSVSRETEVEINETAVEETDEPIAIDPKIIVIAGVALVLLFSAFGVFKK